MIANKDEVLNQFETWRQAKEEKAQCSERMKDAVSTAAEASDIPKKRISKIFTILDKAEQSDYHEILGVVDELAK